MTHYDDEFDEGPGDADADLMDELDEGNVVSCPECGASVWHDAEKCPSCGRWVTRGEMANARGGISGQWGPIVWIIAVIAVVLIMIGVGVIF